MCVCLERASGSLSERDQTSALQQLNLKLISRLICWRRMPTLVFLCELNRHVALEDRGRHQLLRSITLRLRAPPQQVGHCIPYWKYVKKSGISFSKWGKDTRFARSYFILTYWSFAEMPTSSFVESGFWCFDALFVPQQHPARDLQDTFYLSG